MDDNLLRHVRSLIAPHGLAIIRKPGRCDHLPSKNPGEMNKEVIFILSTVLMEISED